MAGGDTLRVIDDHPCNARNVLGKPATEPWGLIAMWIEDPTGSASSWSSFPPITLSAVTRATKMTTDTRPSGRRHALGASGFVFGFWEFEADGH
jgi:hypothetical protein